MKAQRWGCFVTWLLLLPFLAACDEFFGPKHTELPRGTEPSEVGLYYIKERPRMRHSVGWAKEVKLDDGTRCVILALDYPGGGGIDCDFKSMIGSSTHEGHQ